MVSNRLPALRVEGAGTSPVPAGGLASAIFSTLHGRGEGLWLGWDGRVEPSLRVDRLRRKAQGCVTLLGLPLAQREVSDYYHGYCNAVLWPLFHCFQGRVRLSLTQEECYRQVQARFAASLRPLLRPHDRVWVHDYHLLLLGRELRRLGWRGRLGFFLHIPFPPYDLWRVLPEPRDFLRAMLEYDVVGLQTAGSLDNYLYACERLLGARRQGGLLSADDRVQRAAVYPVGIDPADFLPPRADGARRGADGPLSRVVRGRKLILGVDRLDYAKGLPEKILAYGRFLTRHPEWRKRVSFIQIAAPTRTGTAEYVEQKNLVDGLVGRFNGERAEHDWVPIRYLYRSYPRRVLAGFYREAAVGLVTPLRDGMNLVAKEFVAAQRPESPGALVLSRFAGAADELQDAILVNPYVPGDMAEGLRTALEMPLEERRRRHRALLARVLDSTVTSWAARFLDDLDGDGAAASRGPSRTTRPPVLVPTLTAD
jgi:trehalose 6-phosphate synthase